MDGAKTVLSLHAHPDDAEFFCAGTLALLREKGWQIHIATMTPGDCGSAEHSREEISRIRRDEATNSAKLLNGTYHCLECDDMFIMYDKVTLLKAIELLRKVKPSIVFAPSPSDYMCDHEIASNIVQTACFAGGIGNIQIDGVQPFEPTPYLYYVDVHDGKDKFGKKIKPQIVVDISSVIDIKEQMLCCHESQRDWLLKHHGVNEYVQLMKERGAARGKDAHTDFGEGFRQHVGHAFPQDNILKSILGDLVCEK